MPKYKNPGKPRTQGKAVTVIDNDAAEIGKLYQQARSSLVESVKYLIACGEKLATKKASLSHGEWLPWLQDNAAVLGFETPRTAQLLMVAAANAKPASHLDEAAAVAVSRSIWGHDSIEDANFDEAPEAKPEPNPIESNPAPEPVSHDVKPKLPAPQPEPKPEPKPKAERCDCCYEEGELIEVSRAGETAKVHSECVKEWEENFDHWQRRAAVDQAVKNKPALGRIEEYVVAIANFLPPEEGSDEIPEHERVKPETFWEYVTLNRNDDEDDPHVQADWANLIDQAIKTLETIKRARPRLDDSKPEGSA